MRAHLPDSEVNTIGLRELDHDHGDFMGRVLAGGHHWSVDLNKSANVESWPQIAEHDVVVMAEVLEQSPHRATVRAASSIVVSS